jgi:MFS family permease
LFGRLSDVVGRRTGLLLTVLGTTMPVTALALTGNMWVFVVAQVRGHKGGRQETHWVESLAVSI